MVLLFLIIISTNFIVKSHTLLIELKGLKIIEPPKELKCKLIIA